MLEKLWQERRHKKTMEVKGKGEKQVNHKQKKGKGR